GDQDVVQNGREAPHEENGGQDGERGAVALARVRTPDDDCSYGCCHGLSMRGTLPRPKLTMYCLSNQGQRGQGAEIMQPPLRVGIVGVGKIARDQHIPCIAAHPGFKLVAVASRHAAVTGVASYASLEQMLQGTPDLDAVAICTPPQAHYEAARAVLQRGHHVLMEKPPCASLGQLDSLVRLATAAGRTL